MVEEILYSMLLSHPDINCGNNTIIFNDLLC
uniref:Uncharacterized protein n=1 Tax=Rhizophora mucronata TaxID=61149 RepID=A0A2P2NL67_RHIMU